jgi:hypothetical protein
MRAEEVRAIAEGGRDPTAKSIMLRITEDYGRLAEHARESQTLNLALEEVERRSQLSQRPAARGNSRFQGVDLEAAAVLRRAFAAVAAERSADKEAAVVAERGDAAKEMAAEEIGRREHRRPPRKRMIRGAIARFLGR